MYRRPRHNKIDVVLNAFDPDLLLRNEAYFGGGTAITLSLDEYRESIDIDFLCASKEGFSDLRALSFDGGLAALLKPGQHLHQMRDLRRDIYSIRSWIDVDGTPIKVEIVSEGRIDLDGAMDGRFKVPTLSRSDMFAEKLLANADRGHDPTSMHRDIIDLGMMIARWGAIPEAARAKADAAYKGRASKAFELQSRALRSGNRLAACAEQMDISSEATASIMAALGGPLPRGKESHHGWPVSD